MSRIQPEFPPSFASAFGDDEFGIWADLTVNDVAQRFRWIEPGEFLMGSPDNELDRSNVEGPQSRVRISQGYWLADTACTQAFWVAVGDENPSHFKDDVHNPIEQVSWNDINEHWLPLLNENLPIEFEALLPSEAQWEYACRAGTETPFSFGASITLDEVNFFADDQTGLRRDRTVPVKSLPPNSWGLYEMHGNVMEWCRDGRFHYIGLPSVLVDPDGQSSNGLRALRGGSWFHPKRYSRSAFRRAFIPELRRPFIGFRLLLRPRK